MLLEKFVVFLLAAGAPTYAESNFATLTRSFHQAS
jgi:hypothetical protein